MLPPTPGFLRHQKAERAAFDGGDRIYDVVGAETIGIVFARFFEKCHSISGFRVWRCAPASLVHEVSAPA